MISSTGSKQEKIEAKMQKTSLDKAFFLHYTRHDINFPQREGFIVKIPNGQ